jgi:G6PDH family F420-dependent oxidoreductase
LGSLPLKFAIQPTILEYDPVGILNRIPLYEDAGFDELWEGDHTLPWHHANGHCMNALVMTTLYLERSKKIGTVYGVVAPLGFRHHPVDVAMQAATLEITHPGRVGICLGAGEAMNEKTTSGVWPSNRERVERVEEAARLIRECWNSPDYFTFKGKYFKSFFFLYDKPKRKPTLWCAAGGPRMAKIAGRFCDAFVGLGAPTYFKDVLIPAFEEGARKSGRDPSKMYKAAFVDSSYHPDIKKALESARQYGGVLIPECYNLIQDPRIIEQRSRLVRDEVLMQVFNIGSKGDDLIQNFETYVKAGVNYLVWAEISPDPALTSKICKEEVIPYLKKHYSS